ncbi:MAG: flippase-like domain-containing protein [Chloroflexi bacterium]|nr:flippase-like domain-containing protein [Chloroflexota bacterium]
MVARLRLLQVPIVLAIFALFVWRLDVGSVGDALQELEPWQIIVVIALNLPVAALYATRSHLVLLRLGHRIRPSLLAPVAVLGNVAGSFTPASAGEFLRAEALGSHAGVSLKDSAALVLFERVTSLYLMALGAVATFSFLAFPAGVASLIGGACVVGLVLPLVVGRLLDRMPENVSSDGALASVAQRRLAGLSERLRLILTSPGLICLWYAQTVAIFALNTLQFWLLVRAVSGDITFAEAWIAFSLPTLIGVASLIPLGLGAFDGSMAAVFDRLGTTLEQGTVVAVVVRAAISLPMLALALASYLYLVRRLPRPQAELPSVGPVPE